MGRARKESMRKAVKTAKTSVTPARSNNYSWSKKTDIGPNYKQPLLGVSGKGMK